jgi:hypothetical protein
VDSFTIRPLYSGERNPSTDWIWFWVGPKAGLDAVVREKFPAATINRILVVQPVALRLYWPSYPSHLFGSCHWNCLPFRMPKDRNSFFGTVFTHVHALISPRTLRLTTYMVFRDFLIAVAVACSQSVVTTVWYYWGPFLCSTAIASVFLHYCIWSRPAGSIGRRATKTELGQVYKRRTGSPATSQPWGRGQRWSSKRWFVHRSTTRPGQ